LELADEGSGFCGKLLADLGVEVIKVELPAASPPKDSARPGFYPSEEEPGSPGTTENSGFDFHDSGKRRITLNYRHAAGREILLRLAERADVLLEGLVLDNGGGNRLPWETLRERNPRLVLATITGLGDTGPHRTWRSCDLIGAASGGQMYVTGLPGLDPVKLGGTQALYLGSLHAAVAIVMALIRRNRTGYGERLDVSLQETVAAGLDHVLVRYFADASVAGRRGHRYWNNAFFVAPCQDGWLQVAPFQRWDTLVEWMDGESMAGPLTGPAYRDPEYRRAHFGEVERTISQWTARHTRAELFEIAQAMGLPWAPVCTLPEVLASPQLQDREFFVPASEAGDAIRQPAPPYLFLSQVSSVAHGLPGLPGRDNVSIYRDELGFSATELERLAAESVI
jgi:crotonobetainyl-CoA:carnitine CoA-transferase CaiB-like acyl-CoA transferase